MHRSGILLFVIALIFAVHAQDEIEDVEEHIKERRQIKVTLEPETSFEIFSELAQNDESDVIKFRGRPQSNNGVETRFRYYTTQAAETAKFEYIVRLQEFLEVVDPEGDGFQGDESQIVARLPIDGFDPITYETDDNNTHIFIIRTTVGDFEVKYLIGEETLELDELHQDLNPTATKLTVSGSYTFVQEDTFLVLRGSIQTFESVKQRPDGADRDGERSLAVILDDLSAFFSYETFVTLTDGSEVDVLDYFEPLENFTQPNPDDPTHTPDQAIFFLFQKQSTGAGDSIDFVWDPTLGLGNSANALKPLFAIMALLFLFFQF